LGRPVGDLLVRLESVALVREVVTATAASVVLDGFVAVSSLAVLTTLQPSLGALAALLGSLRLAVPLVTRSRRRDLVASALADRSAARGAEVEMLNGIETLKATGSEPRVVERWAQSFVRELRSASARARLDGAQAALLETIALISPLLLLLAGARQVLHGELAVGGMVALVALGSNFLTPLGTLVQVGLQLALVAGVRGRIEDVLTTPAERTGGLRKRKMAGRIELHDVDFRYGTLGPLVLDQLSLSIRPGEFVAVVGPSGCGKSTFGRLLAGLHAPTSGTIRIDGVDLTAVDLAWLRGQIGFVPQTPVLFRSSIRDNIALRNPDLPLRRVIEAAQAAAIHDDIVALPMGYETLLADGGASLAGGQRQRLAVARALAGRPSLLILDEATSNLDSLTERRISNILDGKAFGGTRIVIAHRLSTVRRADRILVLERGRLVSAGTHVELMKQEGLYRKLVEAQTEPPARP
jgi:ATP-binding cassette subfamily B protein